MDNVKTVWIVDIKPAIMSKINWTQIVSMVSLVLSMALGRQFELSADQQAALVGAIGIVGNLVTMVLKTYFTSTITAQSAKNTDFVMKDTPVVVVSKPESAE